MLWSAYWPTIASWISVEWRLHWAPSPNSFCSITISMVMFCCFRFFPINSLSDRRESTYNFNVWLTEHPDWRLQERVHKKAYPIWTTEHWRPSIWFIHLKFTFVCGSIWELEYFGLSVRSHWLRVSNGIRVVISREVEDCVTDFCIFLIIVWFRFLFRRHSLWTITICKHILVLLDRVGLWGVDFGFGSWNCLWIGLRYAKGECILNTKHWC